MTDSRHMLDRKAAAMSIVVAFQGLAAMFFILDVIGDVIAEGTNGHLLTEGAAALALLIAVPVGALQVRALIARSRQDETAVAFSRGAASALIRQRFGEWRLTAAEQEVALFALKGFDAVEIARLRGAAPGTVRAQLTRVYAKAGVKAHSALIALFLDDLIDPMVVRTSVSAGEAV